MFLRSVILECSLIILGMIIGAIAAYLLTAHRRRPVVDEQRATIGGEIPSRGFRGAISDLGLSAVLNMIALEKKSGVLTVWRENTMGHLTFRTGEVLSASLEMRRDAVGEEAIYALLEMHDGTFIFEPKVISSTAPALKPIAHLLLEGAQRADLESQRRRPTQ